MFEFRLIVVIILLSLAKTHYRCSFLCCSIKNPSCGRPRKVRGDVDPNGQGMSTTSRRCFCTVIVLNGPRNTSDAQPVKPKSCNLGCL